MNKQPSRTGKEKKTGKEVKEKSLKSTEKQITTLCEIVPGKFNENDWNLLLDTDETQDVALELIDEVFDNATKIIYEKYLDRQTIPFTTSEAKKAILHIIEWQFLAKDKDDDLSEVFVEDEEPDACIIDSWAQGYVQAFEYEPPQTEIEKSPDEEKIGGNFLQELNNIIDAPKEADQSTSNDEQQTEFEKSARSRKIFTAKQRPSQTKPILKNTMILTDSQEAKKKEYPRVKKVDPEAKKLEESIAKAPPACQTTLKSLLGRPESRKQIEIDLDGNIKNIKKLDFDKLPGQSVKAKFVISDSQKPENIETSRRSKISTLSTLDTNEKTSNSLSTFDAFIGSKKAYVKKSHKRPKRSLCDEEDIELEPAPGVTFTLQNSTRTGPKRQLVPSRQQTIYEKSETYLKPVRQLDKTDFDTRRTLNEILDGYPLLATKPDPFNQLKRIPPITSSS